MRSTCHGGAALFCYSKWGYVVTLECLWSSSFFFFLARHNCVILTVACVHCDGYSVTTCQHRLAAKIGKMISELL